MGHRHAIENGKKNRRYRRDRDSSRDCSRVHGVSQEIQVQYHLYCLRNRPEYLEEIVTAEENSPRRLAIIKYLETDDGKERLFEVYLKIHEGVISAIERVPTLTEAGVLLVHLDRSVTAHIRPEKGRNMTLPIKYTSKWIAPLLSYLVGRSYTAERQGNLVFSFQNSRTAAVDVRMGEFDLPKDAITVSIRRTKNRNSNSLGVDG